VNRSSVGSVVALWRYPVKSMRGEELTAAEVTGRGLKGDRVFALVDSENGKIVSAKNPRKWPNLFEFRAAFRDRERADGPVSITLPDGTSIMSDQENGHRILSQALGREVRLDSIAQNDEKPSAPVRAEGYWPDMEGLGFRDTVTEFELRVGTFFDGAVIHLLTTATLDRLSELYPQGRFDARRFRPNIVVEPTSGERGFVENEWIGQSFAIGDEVRLSITRPCGRCVMTTLAQGGLPRDPDILRTVAQHNDAKIGVYASVVRGGPIRAGDTVRRLG
jgi:uncharacterized protein